MIPLPELAHEPPTLAIYIELLPELILKTNVAQMCNEMIENLSDMEAGDYERIAQLYQRMKEIRDAPENLNVYAAGQQSLFHVLAE